MKSWGLTLTVVMLLIAQLIAGATLAEEQSAFTSANLVMLPGAMTGSAHMDR
jgi:hypothetical protein